MTAINLQPTLEDERFLLRPLKKDDFDALYDAAKDPLIWEQHPNKRHKRDVFAEFFKDAVESGGAFVIIDKESRQIIGTTRFKPVKDIHSAIEIGWTFLARNYWGGAANKAVKTLMINYTFQYYNDVILYIDKNNIRSQKAAEKIDARRQPDDSPFNGNRRHQMDIAYRIHKNDWTASNG